MADNFDFKQYLFENKLGAYSNLKEEKSITTYVDKQEGGEEVKVTITDLGDKINVEQIIGRIPRSITIPKDQLESAYAASNRGVIKLPDGKKAFLQQDVYDQLMDTPEKEIEETVEEGSMSLNTPFNRMEDRASIPDLIALKNKLRTLSANWMKEGFEKEDIIEYLSYLVNEIKWQK